MSALVVPSVDWWITSRCNLSCDFCYGPAPAADPKIRQEIASSIAKTPCPVVTFCGGEPLLVPKLFLYARQLRTVGKKVVLNTNGELLCRLSNDRQVSESLDVIGISVDGPNSSVHKAMRGPNASYHKTWAAAEWIAEQRLCSLKIATVVSKVNAGHLGELADQVAALSPDVWRLYQYSPWGPVNRGQSRHGLGAEEFDFLVATATKRAFPTPVYASSNELTSGCLLIDPFGRVQVQRGDGYEAIGNCLDEEIISIWSRHPRADTVMTNKSWLTIVDTPEVETDV